MRDTFTRRDNIVLKTRNLMSNLPKLGMVPKPIQNDGITFLIPVKNEEKWIELSILSVIDAAEEVIVVDSSTEDSTSEIVSGLAKENDKIKHLRFYWGGNNAIGLARHLALMNAHTRWIFDWEGDQVVKPEGLKIWVDRLKQLDRNVYYMIDVPRLNFSSDLKHLSKNTPFGYQGRIYTWSPQLKYIIDRRCGVGQEHTAGDTIWGPRLPPWYKLLRWSLPYAYHVNLKDLKRSVERQFWEDYMKNSEGYRTLEDYAAYRISKENLTIEQAKEKVLAEIRKDTIPYDIEKYGELPECLNNITINVKQ
jgi:glycosyltransferase involved in cell wall biosynthesis